MERNYFGVIRNTTCSQVNKPTEKFENDVGSFISTAILHAPGPVKSFLGTGIIAANHYNYSWQNLVEDAVLGSNIADKPLDNITLTAEARKHFGEAMITFNWNQLPRWNQTNGPDCSKWFLQNTDGQHIQRPVYTSALYQQLPGNSGIKVELNMQGRPVKGLFKACHSNTCPRTHDNMGSFALAAIATTVSSWVGLPPPPPPSDVPLLSTECADFNLGSLTVGQVASASSAAAGGAAVGEWVHNIIELAQHKAKDSSRIIWYCSFYGMLFESFVGACNKDVAVGELLKLIGCSTPDGDKEDAVTTAQRWSTFLEKMAVEMVVNSSSPEHVHAGHMAIDAVNY